MTAGRGLDSFASASAAGSQHHAISSQLGSLQGRQQVPLCLPPSICFTSGGTLIAGVHDQELCSSCMDLSALGPGRWTEMGVKGYHTT